MIEWSLSDGTIIGNNNVVEVDLPQARISLG